MMAGVRLYRVVGTTFRSIGWTFVAIVLICLIQFACWSLLEAVGLRKLLVETLHVSLMFFLVGAVGPLVNGPQK